DWTAGALRVETDNEEPNSSFRQTAGAAALGMRLGDRSSLRFVARGATSTAGTPGPTLYGRPDLDASIQRHLVVVGGRLLGARAEPLLSPRRTNVGAYAQDRFVVGDRLFVTAGARVEHNASFGTRAVPRAAVAWRLRGTADATTLRASAGTGIKEPSFFQS